ncbi:hypothetical protein [Photobacterium kasasachensis]|uniref:hypothetical protein n=1 Tax=Photobacterium kasasachensis TaxID=2910240 RepID=UPI003D131BD6
MGLDTAYIPVKKQDIDYFVSEVAATPGLLNKRLNLLSKSQDSITFLREGLYERIISHNEQHSFDDNFGFAACGILAYLNPYYYDRGQSLMDIALRIRSVSKLLIEQFEDFYTCFPSIKHCGDSGVANYRSGVYIPEAKIEAVLEILSDPAVSDVANVGQQDGLMVALRYALKHNTGLLEAFDLYVPASGECFTSFYNMKAQFLNNLDNELTEADCEHTGLTIGIPAPSSSQISLDEFGQLILEWIEIENALPAYNGQSNAARLMPGDISMTLMCAESTPLVLISTTQNIFIHDCQQYVALLIGSLSDFLEQKSLAANFFISTQDENKVPEDIASVDNCNLRYGMKPSFILQTKHNWKFLFDELQVEMWLGMSGKMQVFLNGDCIDSYKVSFTKQHRTVFFANGAWYTISVKSFKLTTGEIDIQLHKGMFLQARFRFIQGSEVYPKSVNRTLIAGEMLTVLFTALLIMMPRPFTFLPVLLLLGAMYKFNKRHHYQLKPLSLDEDEVDQK